MSFTDRPGSDWCCPRAGPPFALADAALVSVDAARGAFHLRLLVDLSAGFPRDTALSGRFAVEPPYLHTAIVLAA